MDELKRGLASYLKGGMKPVINATGVVLHTNLGRAPLSLEAVEAIRQAASGYVNLEYEIGTGKRGGRGRRVEEQLIRLTGAESALVVNNNAASLLLALSVLAQGREAVVARGELVQIGGGFRVPDILSACGVRLKEVGTTNVVALEDYEGAIGSETALLLQVHPSNFRIEGFTGRVPLRDLVALGERRGLPVLSDLGSGCLVDTHPLGWKYEPTVGGTLAAGPDVVCFSGDKLLGGPQAGILLGKGRSIEPMRRHPIYRALRPDKMALAGLEATLAAYLDGNPLEILPVWRMLGATEDEIAGRARRLKERLDALPGIRVFLLKGRSEVGGGALSEGGLPTLLMAIEGPQGEEPLARALRMWEPPVIARVEDGKVLLDLRTVFPEQDETLLKALQGALQRDD
jgi:L-seryl-tRNA(Ser) seleniumtransferase